MPKPKGQEWCLMEPSGNDPAIKAEIRTCVLKSACSLSTELKESDLLCSFFLSKMGRFEKLCKFPMPQFRNGKAHLKSQPMETHQEKEKSWKLIYHRDTFAQNILVYKFPYFKISQWGSPVLGSLFRGRARYRSKAENKRRWNVIKTLKTRRSCHVSCKG